MPNKPKTHLSRLHRTGRRHVDGHSPGTNNPVVRAIRNSSRYRKVVAKARRLSPLCCDPFNWHKHDGITQPTAQIHHVIGVADDPQLAFVLENLASVCTKCHAYIEARVRDGERTAFLFDGKRVIEFRQKF